MITWLMWTMLERPQMYARDALELEARLCELDRVRAFITGEPTTTNPGSVPYFEYCREHDIGSTTYASRLYLNLHGRWPHEANRSVHTDEMFSKVADFWRHYLNGESAMPINLPF